ncbi:Smr/MutS family protein [Hyphomonas sp.]|uniref:Smr/MutS family protein n=1 Tax=Hyphomonas sp. TaxID=87 RepID=UPI0032EFFB11|tara:strand:- start:19041 stop:19589 length:549 start_codon:yes stop_codon:yes gene_type:complete
MSKRRLTPDEAKAWSRVARSIKRIGPQPTDFEALISALEAGEPAGNAPTSPPATPPTRPVSPLSQPSTSHHPPVSTPANRGKEKRVRRGKLAVAATFDLHGHTQASAARALPGFLSNAQLDGARCVLVITGKGRLGEGVLKRNFLAWLETPEARSMVSGYAEAHQRHGGAGAFYVFLRKLQL